MRASKVMMRGRSASLLVFACLAAACIAIACGGGSSGESCPSNDLPSACPSNVPSYANDIAPILRSRCGPCHFPGGVEDSQHDYSTYAHVYAQRGTMLNQVYSCSMPPSGSPPPTADERAKLLAWFVCNAPNN
jgi:hypothetical protein